MASSRPRLCSLRSLRLGKTGRSCRGDAPCSISAPRLRRSGCPRYATRTCKVLYRRRALGRPLECISSCARAFRVFCHVPQSFSCQISDCCAIFSLSRGVYAPIRGVYFSNGALTCDSASTLAFGETYPRATVSVGLRRSLPAVIVLCLRAVPCCDVACSSCRVRASNRVSTLTAGSCALTSTSAATSSRVASSSTFPLDSGKRWSLSAATVPLSWGSCHRLPQEEIFALTSPLDR